MRTTTPVEPRIAIACGGTGGHLYPGLAVAQRLSERGAHVTLLISAKEVDRRGVQCEARHEVITIPAVGFSVRRFLPFFVQGWKSFRIARRAFQTARPDVFLSMGGFTSAPPALAARAARVDVVLHEANAIPGRANRWLAQFARRGYVYFPEAAAWLRRCEVETLGMPVREQFQPLDPGASRLTLGLAPDRPVLLVMGGSQGASGINKIVIESARAVIARVPGLQILHLAGSRDEAAVRTAYRSAGIQAVVRAFLSEMEVALSSADAVISRAGASSIAEIAALRVPALLIPYPHAADDHQVANARALERTGAAWLLNQDEATPDRVEDELVCLLTDEGIRAGLKARLELWHRPNADVELAEGLLALAQQPSRRAQRARTAESRAEPVSTP